jgi:hypothetical protein
MLQAAFRPRPRALAPATKPGRSPRTEQAIQVVLKLLREQLGMDVVHVGHYREGERRFRVVEALQHGPAAALATSRPTGAAPPAAPDRDAHQAARRQRARLAVLLEPGRRSGRGRAAPAPAAHGARLAARLLDNEQVLRELARQAHSHQTHRAAAAPAARPAPPARSP